MIEFGLRDEADAALAAMVETFLTKGPFKVHEWKLRVIEAAFSVHHKSDWNKARYDCDSQEEAEAVCALLNYRHYKAK